MTLLPKTPPLCSKSISYMPACFFSSLILISTLSFFKLYQWWLYFISYLMKRRAWSFHWFVSAFVPAFYGSDTFLIAHPETLSDTFSRAAAWQRPPLMMSLSYYIRFIDWTWIHKYVAYIPKSSSHKSNLIQMRFGHCFLFAPLE